MAVFGRYGVMLPSLSRATNDEDCMCLQTCLKQIMILQLVIWNAVNVGQEMKGDVADSWDLIIDEVANAFIFNRIVGLFY